MVLSKKEVLLMSSMTKKVRDITQITTIGVVVVILGILGFIVGLIGISIVHNVFGLPIWVSVITFLSLLSIMLFIAWTWGLFGRWKN